MSRVRVSTTVDEATLNECRRLLDQPDSKLIDQALIALVRQIEGDAEKEALEAYPYDDDADLAWVPDPPALEYDGEAPKEVLARAQALRRSRRAQIKRGKP